MAKEWFHHDYGTRNKKKLAVLIHKEGSRGYGLFWIIVEMLYEDRRKKMEIDDSTYLAIKKESGEDIKRIQEFIKKCIEVYKVFKRVGKSFFSTTRVLENDKHRREISKKNSANGRKSYQSRSNKERTVNASLQVVNAPSTEEMRGDEMRGDERESIIGEPPKIEVTTPVLKQEPAPDLKNSNLFKKPNIPTWQQVLETFVMAGGTEEMAKSFFQKHEGTGWFINSSPITNYVALAQKFIQTWKSNEESRGKKTELPAHMQSTGGPKLKTLS